MTDNPRVVNTLLIIARAIFQHEMKFNNVKDMTSVFRTDSPFKTIFNLIFDCQSANQAFNHRIITKSIHSIVKLCESAKRTKDGYVFSIAQMEELLLMTLNDIKKAMELIDGIDIAGAAMQNKSKTLTIEILSILNFVYKELYLKATDA